MSRNWGNLYLMQHSGNGVTLETARHDAAAYSGPRNHRMTGWQRVKTRGTSPKTDKNKYSVPGIDCGIEWSARTERPLNLFQSGFVSLCPPIEEQREFLSAVVVYLGGHGHMRFRPN
jgi:hypothetical protein